MMPAMMMIMSKLIIMMMWMTVTSNRYNTNDPNQSDD